SSGALLALHSFPTRRSSDLWAAKPSPIKQLFFIGGGGLAILWMATSSFVSNAGPVLITLFVIWGLLVVFYFGGMTKTKELRAMTDRKSTRLNSSHVSTSYAV